VTHLHTEPPTKRNNSTLSQYSNANSRYATSKQLANIGHTPEFQIKRNTRKKALPPPYENKNVREHLEGGTAVHVIRGEESPNTVKMKKLFP